MALQIRNTRLIDAPKIREIYNHYIRETVATFEEVELVDRQVQARIGKVLEAGLPHLVAVKDGLVVGFAYADSWKDRSAYRHTVEAAIYLNPRFLAQGIGSQLYATLFARLKEQDIHVIICGISLPNEESVALHEKFALQKVAHFKEVGYKFGNWVDVGYWQGSPI